MYSTVNDHQYIVSSDRCPPWLTFLINSISKGLGINLPGACDAIYAAWKAGSTALSDSNQSCEDLKCTGYPTINVTLGKGAIMNATESATKIQDWITKNPKVDKVKAITNILLCNAGCRDCTSYYSKLQGDNKNQCKFDKDKDTDRSCATFCTRGDCCGSFFSGINLYIIGAIVILLLIYLFNYNRNTRFIIVTFELILLSILLLRAGISYGKITTDDLKVNIPSSDIPINKIDYVLISLIVIYIIYMVNNRSRFIKIGSLLVIILLCIFGYLSYNGNITKDIINTVFINN